MTRPARLLAVPLLLATGVGAALAPVPASAAPASAVALEAPPTTVGHLRTNALTDPLGIAGRAPQLSWQLEGTRRGIEQTGYQVRVASSSDRLGSPDVWDSGKVDGRRSVGVTYGGPALTSHTRYVWSVRVWDDTGSVSGWSDPATFETGLLDAAEWRADWISEPAQTLGNEWRDYTVEFTASDIRGALGVYFRGRDNDHAYMWQLSESQRALRPHVKNPGYSVLSATPFPAGFDFAAAHDYAISVSGTEITTTVDGTVLDRRTNATHTAPGIMGFRTDGQETGLVHDVKVTSANGQVLVDTDFPAGDRTFTGGTVTADGLRAGAPNHEAWLFREDAVPLLRDDFTLADKPIASARIYASARGLYELRVNGEPVGDHELAPGWTDYRKRIQYQTYDVTDLVTAGGNAWGGELADGWWSGRVGFTGGENYGTRNELVAQLRVEYADGTEQVVATDGSWTTRPGPRTEADLLDGESYDARRAAAIGDWTEAGYDAGDWDSVEVRESGTDLLEPQDDQPVRVTDELRAERLPSPENGVYVYDLGQNMVGRARITLQGEPGRTARIRFAEVLNPDGSLYTANFRSAKVTDYYTFGSDQPETFEPEFTFHGFRYVEVTGVSEAPDSSDVTGVVLGTDADHTSSLDTSSDLVDQLHSNITWGQRGNFLSLPTDTPARDERLGWTGDINVFARTAVYNMDSQAFLSKWLQDLRDSQRADGALPGIAPVIPNRVDGGYAPSGWADAGLHVPWTLWQAYGDTAVLADNWEMMTAYMGYLRRTANGLIRTEGGYLDWLNLDDPTSADVIDTAFFAKGAREMAQMAEALGKDAQAAEYRDLYRDIRQAYIGAFISADGTVKGDSQTAYILTITNDLVPDDRRDKLADQFVETIQRRDWHLSTGFLGVDGLLPALSAVDRTDVAYRLLQNEDYPSWGYEIGKGATTIWERWNSIMPDGSFGPVEMNSFNHYAYGAVGEWMYRSMAGVSALEPGYARVLVAPEPGDGITSSDFSHRTPYGEVRSAWRETDDGLRLDVTVPPNATAEIRVPAFSHWAVREGGKPADDAAGVEYLREKDDVASFSVGSGSYSFSVDAALGHVGVANDAGDDLAALVEQLAGDQRLRADVVGHFRDQLSPLATELDEAWSAAAAGDESLAVARVHRALSRITTLDAWVTGQAARGRIGQPEATQLHAAIAAVEESLSAASGAYLGVVATMSPAAGEWLPGETRRVDVGIENTGTSTLSSLASSLGLPAGWTATPVGTRADSVAAGATVTHRYDVSVPAGTAPATVPLGGAVTYRVQSSDARIPLIGAVPVGPAVVVAGVDVPAAPADPGQAVTVSTQLRNRTTAAQSGSLSLVLPDGWTAPAEQSWSLPAGGATTLTTQVTVPLSVTEGPATVVAAVGDAAGERGSGSLQVRLANPPAGILDHVDLGNAASESAHGLTASAASGTNVEAGLTRRYTNAGQPGGWFEHDLAVTPGQPFVLRAIETYDAPAFKTYDVLVDGTTVELRRYRRTTAGAGTVTYQFVVDLPAATADGRVRIRWQDVGADHDPSIADVWATRLP